MLGEVGEGFEGDIGVDGACAVADEEAEVVGFAGLAGFDDESGLGASALADEVVVYGGGGEEARDGCVALIDAAVGEDEEGSAVLDSVGGVGAEFVEGPLEACFAVGDMEEHGDGDGAEVTGFDFADFFEVGIAEDGLFEFDEVAGLGGFVEEVCLTAEVGEEAGDEGFEVGVERWVGDLGEELFEVVIEQLGLVGEAGEGCIGAHGAEGFLAGGGHGEDDHFEVFDGVAEDVMT